MKTYEENGWMVTTPIYAGSRADVAHAGACTHKAYVKLTRSVEQGTLVIHERCKWCVATRVRYRPAERASK